MKALILTLALLPLISNAACPDLAGSYKTCEDSGSDELTMDIKDLVVTQAQLSDGTQYNFTGTDTDDGTRDTETYMADGKKVTTGGDEDEAGSTTITKCEDDALVATTEFPSEDGKTSVAGVEFKAYKQGAKLIMESTLKGPEGAIKNKTICQ